jgi:hypothetical protein
VRPGNAHTAAAACACWCASAPDATTLAAASWDDAGSVLRARLVMGQSSKGNVVVVESIGLRRRTLLRHRCRPAACVRVALLLRAFGALRSAVAALLLEAFELPVE